VKVWHPGEATRYIHRFVNQQRGGSTNKLISKSIQE
jgi:hypothetical protein